MKQIILISTFLFILVVQLYGQREDSIRIDGHEQFPQTIKADSSILKKSNSLVPLSSFPTKENEPLSAGKEMAVRYDLSKDKKTFFNSSYSRFIIPTALISYGIVARGNKSLLNLDRSTNHEVGEHLTRRVPYDDYTQFAPSIAIYGLDWAGIKAKHNFRDRTLVVATSFLIMGATVQTMKTSFAIERPDHSNNHSFPSGHTATAFVGAHILFKEYKDVSPWIGVGGYVIASATGVMRVFNKKHWISDVVVGAGVGIMSAEIGYMLLPIWHNVLGIKEKDKSLVIAPVVSPESAGVGLVYTF
ncbi:MAG: phosphatase PAP2 family protein [Dysgonomonas sp.]